jgi:two-component system OmpR family sensor kinase
MAGTTTGMMTTTARATTMEGGDADRATTTDPSTPDGRAYSSTIGTARRRLTGIRGRIVVGYAVLMATALTVAIVIARQVHVARVERTIEIELVEESDKLRQLADDVAPNTDRDVRDLFDAFLASNVASDNEAFYTIPFDSASPGDGIRYSFGAPTRLLDDDELIGRLSSVRAPTMSAYDTPDGNIRALVMPIVGSSAGTEPRVLGVAVIAHFTAQDWHEVNELVRVLVLTGIAALATTTALAWWLAGRIISPVRQLTATARGITHSDLSARIPVSGHDELAELGATFNAMVDRLDTGFRAQRQFLDDIAHDLRTPITIARGHLEVLGDDPAERDDAVAVVLDELDRMSRSVSDLLVLAKAERPDFLRVRPVDFHDLVNDIMQRASALARRTWLIDTVPQPGALVGPADPDRLIQAMLNLAVNAVEHTDDGDEIGIGAETAGNTTSPTVRLEIRDTGQGVDAEVADRLFDRYERGSVKRDRGEGMGLGLTIVEAIARAHGGSAEYAENPGGGARFTLQIPLGEPS